MCPCGTGFLDAVGGYFTGPKVLKRVQPKTACPFVWSDDDVMLVISEDVKGRKTGLQDLEIQMPNIGSPHQSLTTAITCIKTSSLPGTVEAARRTPSRNLASVSRPWSFLQCTFHSWCSRNTLAPPPLTVYRLLTVQFVHRSLRQRRVIYTAEP